MVMDRSDATMTIHELSDRSGVPVRTIRYYVAGGLIPNPVGRGKGAEYSDEHLERLMLVRNLADRRIPLREIASTVGALSAEEVGKLLKNQRRRTSLEREAQSSSPKEYVSALLDRARETSPVRSEISMPADLLAGPEPAGSADIWRRIELSPGVELHVALAVENRNLELIRRIEQISRELRRNGDG